MFVVVGRIGNTRRRLFVPRFQKIKKKTERENYPNPWSLLLLACRLSYSTRLTKSISIMTTTMMSTATDNQPAAAIGKRRKKNQQAEERQQQRKEAKKSTLLGMI